MLFEWGLSSVSVGGTLHGNCEEQGGDDTNWSIVPLTGGFHQLVFKKLVAYSVITSSIGYGHYDSH